MHTYFTCRQREGGKDGWRKRRKKSAHTRTIMLEWNPWQWPSKEPRKPTVSWWHLCRQPSKCSRTFSPPSKPILDQGSLIFPKCLNWLHFYANESHISSDTLLLTSALVWIILTAHQGLTCGLLYFAFEGLDCGMASTSLHPSDELFMNLACIHYNVF